MTTSEPPQGLTRGTLGGLSWVYSATAAGAVMQLVYTAVMGRLLPPADFGLVAMALIVQRFGTYFAEMGVGQALIQKPDLDEGDVRVGFTTSVLLGLLFGLAIVGAAPLAAVFFETPAVTPVVRVLALSFVFSSLGRVATSLLRRELRFKALSGVEFATHAVAFLGVGIGMALLGFGVWSLVGAQIAQGLLQSVLAFAARPHSLVPLFVWTRARAIYGYGARVSVISFLEFLGGSLDSLLIGRYAGSQPLGHYNRAFLLVNLPFQQVVTGLSGVLFPAFSRVQDDLDRLRGAYRSSIGIMAAFLLPAAAGLAAAAPEVILVVLGPEWDLAAAVLPALAIAASLNFLSHLAGVACAATATLNWKLVLQLLYLLLLATLLLAASRSGHLVYYAWAVMAAALFRQVLYMRLMDRVLALGLRAHLALYGPAALTAVAVAAALTAVTWSLHRVAPVAVVFAGQAATGAIVLLVSLLWGPLVGTRRDVRTRLEQAGLLAGAGGLTRLARTLLDIGR